MTTADAHPEPLSDEEENPLRSLARTLVFIPRSFITDLAATTALSLGAQ